MGETGGLRPDEWRQLYHGDTGLNFLQQGVVTVTSFAGISANIFAHLRQDWITWRDNHIRIRVPAEADCNDFRLDVSGGQRWPEMQGLVDRSEPCSNCKKAGEKDKFENFGGWSQGEKRSVEVILEHEVASPAVEFLRTVFKTYERPSIAAVPKAVTDAALRIADKGISYSKFQRTAPVIYAYYGLSADQISEILPYAEGTIRNAVKATPGVSFEQLTTFELLKEISDAEPVTRYELADRTGKHPHGCIGKRLKSLKKVGRVECCANKGSVPEKEEWRVVGDWREPMKCDECGFSSMSLTALNTHIGMMHGTSESS